MNFKLVWSELPGLGYQLRFCAKPRPGVGVGSCHSQRYLFLGLEGDCRFWDTANAFRTLGPVLDSKQLSYTDVALKLAQMMKFTEIELGLLPVGYGAVVPLVDLLCDDVRSQLEDPQQLLLDPDKPAPHSLRARVHALDHEWGQIVRCCIRRGVMREITYDDIYRHQGS